MRPNAPLEAVQRAEEEPLPGGGEETGFDRRRAIDDDGKDGIEIARLLLPANAATIAAGRVPLAEAETRHCIVCTAI